MFTGLLFVPKRPPFDLFSPETQHGVRLYVRRVFIMDDCEELLPRWLRFVRGVVDSDDLPLNVSRELLQDSAIVRTIQQAGHHARARPARRDRRAAHRRLPRLLAQVRPVLKEGLHFDPSHKDKLATLLRYESSKGEGLISLAEYVARMPEGQTQHLLRDRPVATRCSSTARTSRRSSSAATKCCT